MTTFQLSPRANSYGAVAEVMRLREEAGQPPVQFSQDLYTGENGYNIIAVEDEEAAQQLIDVLNNRGISFDLT